MLASMIAHQNSPEVELDSLREVWLKQGAVPVVKTAAEFDSFLRKDIDKWGKLIKSANITVQ